MTLPCGLTIRTAHNRAACFIRVRKQVKERMQDRNHNILQPHLGSGMLPLLPYCVGCQHVPHPAHIQWESISQGCEGQEVGITGRHVGGHLPQSLFVVRDLTEVEEEPEVNAFPNKAFKS